MTGLHGFAAQWLVHALGWTLLHFCWQGAVIAALLWSGLQLLAGRSAQARYVAAFLALALMVLAPLATFGHMAAAEHRLTEPLRRPAIAVSGLAPGEGGGDALWLAQLATALDPAVPWVLMAWMAGSALFLFRLSVGFESTRRLRTVAVSLAAEELQLLLARLTQRLRVTRPVVLLSSALVQAPTVIGWLRPVVLIPVSCFAGLPPAQIEAILCHELAHIRRHDYLVSMVQSVVEALLFYHPAVWWVSRQVRRERECCCDDVAVTVGGDALAYARALTALEVQRSLYPQVALGANGGILTMRIKRLLVAESSSAASQVAAVAVLAGLMVAAIAVAGTARAEARPMAVAAPLAAAAPAPAAAPAVVAAPAPVASPRPASPRAKANAVSALKAEDVPAAEPQIAEPEEQQAPLKVEGGVAAGNILSKAQPSYPPDARAAHIQGAVVLRAIISATGEIENLQVIGGPPELYASALDAVRQWKYKPYLLNGQPTEVETTITVNYHMAA